MSTDQLVEKKFRPEIEGLRAIAAILVAVYHIWLGRVSGGVDVFFVISGFLITTSLLSRYETNGSFKIGDYYLNLARRLFPLALFVLTLTAISSFLWLPQVRWIETIKQFIASALYFENWQLAFNSIDYLAENSVSSPVQHFWAMSLQGQFYLIWPFVILLAIFFSKNLFKMRSLKFSVLFVFILIFFVSITYSVYKTSENQAWAYFDTFARVWEFSLGGLLAVTISNIRLNSTSSIVIGWTGFLAITLTGLLIPVSTMFPGYIALIPTLGAVFIVISSKNAGNFGVHRLLSIKPLVSLGSVSYGIYLYHWPILVFYYILTDRSDVPLHHGLFIIIASIALSYITTNLIERPIRQINLMKYRIRIGAIITSGLVFFLGMISIWNVSIQKELEIANYNNTGISLHLEYEESQQLSINDIIPRPLLSKEDIPISYHDGCHQGIGKSTVIKCYYGHTDPEYTIALVGGSHSAHWFPALEEIAKENKIEIVNMTKSGCRFTTDPNVVEDCFDFNNNLIDSIIDLNPDIVFTTADIGESQEIPVGYLEQWEKLANHNINVFAIRDNGRFPFDPPTCIEEHGVNSEECKLPREEFMPEESPWEQLKTKPENVYYFETGDYFCKDDECGPVVGRILAFRDKGHITATFARAMAPYIKPALFEALENKK